MSPKILGSILLVVLIPLFPSATVGQSIGGTFLGVVKDQAGPVPDVEVRITNLATGQVRIAYTDRRGGYGLLEVPPGQYEFRVSKDGYNVVSTPSAQGLQLGLAQVARVNEITLNVAPAGAAIIEEHSLEVAMTDSDRPTLGTAFAGQQLRELPLSARDVNNLAVLAPGAVSVTSFSFANTLVPFSVNGSRGRDNNFIIDSVDNNEPLFGGAATQFSNTEIFSEFRILTGQFQAEYGRNSGSIVNVVTRQGGKQLHGSLFWYGQNDGLNAMTKVEKQSELTKPARFYENQLGASIGGPIDKDSTRYFISYQWDRARNDLSSEYPVVATLPTSAGLSMLRTISAVNPTPTLAAFLADPTVKDVDSLTGLPCAIPNASITFGLNATNPCTTGNATWVAPFVAPNCSNTPSPCVSIPFGTYLVPHANVFDFRDHEGSARIDQKVGQRENLFFRYLLDDLKTPLDVISDPNQVGYSDLGLLPQWRNILAERTQNFGSSWTHAFDRALNELRFSFSRISSERGPLDADPKARELPQITIGNENDVNQTAAFVGVFAPDVIGFHAVGHFISLGSDTRSSRVNNNLSQVQENYSTVHGIHSLKFGGNFIETRSDLRQVNGDLGHYFYSSFSDFMNNIPTAEGAIAGYQRFGNLGGRGGEVLPLREFAQFYFAEDDIKVSARFTLNLGIRYENYSQAYDRVVDLSASNPHSPPRLGRVNTNFAPRVGLAWQLGNNTVLRGGYGIYYDPVFFNIALLAWQSGPISPYISGLANNAFPNPPFNPIEVQVPPLGIPPPLDATNQNTVSKSLRNPFVHDASLSLQHQLGKDVSLQVSYFGSRGTKLFQRLEVNPYGGWRVVTSPPPSGQPCSFISSGQVCAFLLPPLQPNRGSIVEMSNRDFSNYHALQFSATKRARGAGFWNGMALTAAYTWSHMTDNSSEVFGPGIERTGLIPKVGSTFAEPFEISTPFPQDASDTRNGEKGNSSFDRRHRFALSFAWALPSPSPKPVRTLLSNWEINGVIAAQTGQPFTPLNSSSPVPGGGFGDSGFLDIDSALAGGIPGGCGDVGGDGIPYNDRPNIGNPNAPANTAALLNNFYCLDPSSTVPGVSNFVRMSGSKLVQMCGDYIAPDWSCINDLKTVRFVQVGIGCVQVCGNAGRNILTGPGIVNFDLSLSKTLRFGERLSVQLRGDAYDLLNRQNAGPLAGNPYSTSAAQVTAIAYYPIAKSAQTGINDCVFGTLQACAFPPARLSGLTPENSIDTVNPVTGKSALLSRHFLTVTNRRMQLSLKLTF